jgi:thiamine-phosphate pyrophosphorylase
MAAPRLYLITPPVLGETSLRALGALVERYDVACVRLALASADEAEIRRGADAVREIGHARDVNVVVARHFRLAGGLGLDGVHLEDGARSVREARKALGRDAIVGAHGGVSRHEGMTAAEIGADYVSFGPVTASGLGDGRTADIDLFSWWSEMIEVPVVAEGGITPEAAAALGGAVDFLALGEELWGHPEGPEAALAAIVAALPGSG